MGIPHREMWEQTAKKGDTVCAGTGYERRQTQDEWTLVHDFAGEGNRAEGGSILRIGEKINGSGGDTFGNAKRWPYVAIETSLPAGREDLATDLAEELQEVVARFLHDHGLVRT